MPFNILGKLLFPRSQPWERKRKARQIIAVIGAALIGAAIIGAMLYKQNSIRH